MKLYIDISSIVNKMNLTLVLPFLFTFTIIFFQVVLAVSKTFAMNLRINVPLSTNKKPF